MPFSLGPLELGIILVIVIVIFGAGKLPEIGTALGRSIRGFKTEVKDASTEEPETVTKADLRAETTRPAETARPVETTRPVQKDEAVR